MNIGQTPNVGVGKCTKKNAGQSRASCPKPACPQCGSPLKATECHAIAFPGSPPFWRMTCAKCNWFGRHFDTRNKCIASKKMEDKHKILRAPNSEGFWWMNDPRAYGWEVVKVQRNSILKEFTIFHAGIHNADQVEPWCVEWVKIEKPGE